MRLDLKVVPGASRTRVAGWFGERLKIQVAVPPERGKANAAVIELLAGLLGLPKSAVRLVAGASSPQKTVEIAAGEEDVRRALRRVAGEG